MIGDIPDIRSRIKAVLPSRWFSDVSPVLDTILAGPAAAWSAIYSLLGLVRAQSRLGTASGSFLEAISTDFFAARLPRRAAEPDSNYRSRIAAALLGEHATRSALHVALNDLTGLAPSIFEPSRPADTGCYAGPALGYGVAGAWGSLSLPFQVFVSVYRPPPPGIANVAGYGTSGPLARANISEVGGQLADSEIHSAITSVMPTASIAWTRIIN